MTDWTEVILRIKAAANDVNPQEHSRLHALLLAALVDAENARRADAGREGPDGQPVDLTGLKSFAGPYRLGTTTDRPADCTCERWTLTYELNRHADSGVDSVDWHEPDCGYWRRHIAREDFGRPS